MSDLAKGLYTRIRALKLETLRDALAKCDERQVAFFHRLYPDGPSDDQFDNALDQIERTIKKNEALTDLDRIAKGEKP